MRFKKEVRQKKRCKHCKKRLREDAYHFSNQIAIEKGYCSFACMSGDLGNEEALIVLQEVLGKNKGVKK